MLKHPSLSLCLSASPATLLASLISNWHSKCVRFFVRLCQVSWKSQDKLPLRCSVSMSKRQSPHWCITSPHKFQFLWQRPEVLPQGHERPWETVTVSAKAWINTPCQELGKIPEIKLDAVWWCGKPKCCRRTWVVTWNHQFVSNIPGILKRLFVYIKYTGIYG